MPSAARPPAWLWFNLLSLDAPVIALVWQDFVARRYPTVLLPTGRAVLGLTVWAIYLADRLLDTRRPVSLVETARHQFYRRHRTFAQTLFALVAGVDLLFTGLWLRPAVFANGLLLSGGVVVYLGTFSFTGWRATAWKKPLAAILFTAGTFLIAWTGSDRRTLHLALPAAAFCALCLGNLLMIEQWSREPAPKLRKTLPGAFALLVVAVCLACTGDTAWFAAIAISAAGLCALARWGSTLSGDARCVLADALLLTPLLFR